MTRTIGQLYAGIILGSLTLVIVWDALGQFDVEPLGFIRPWLLLPAPLAIGLYYSFVRKDQRIAAATLGICFIFVYQPMAGVLSYFALNVNGPRIDDQLAAIDRAMGFNWPSVMEWISTHPVLAKASEPMYYFGIWQIPPLFLLMGWRCAPSDINKLCLSMAVCAYITIGFWAIWPSFGANTVYVLPPEFWHRMFVFGDDKYGQFLLSLYHYGPGKITAANVHGLVGFPSYHAAICCMVIWFTRNRLLGLLFIPLNLLVIAVTPIQGGHHFVDILGGAVAAAIGVVIAGKIVDWATARDEAQNEKYREMELTQCVR